MARLANPGVEFTTAAIFDSQSVKSAEKGGAVSIRMAMMRARRSKVKGKKRHLLVDTLGLLLHAIVHPADIQDRDGGIFLLATLFGMYPFLKKLFADGGYQGPEFQKALTRILRLRFYEKRFEDDISSIGEGFQFVLVF